MSPVKPALHATRLRSVAIVFDIIEGPPPNRPLPDYSSTLEHLSTVKGLFNRIWLEDQWDWFTVTAQLGHPSAAVARIIGQQLAAFRKAIRDSQAPEFRASRDRLRHLPTRRCLGSFLGRSTVPEAQGAGWLYVLSTRDLPDLLKIGMTTRTVEERAREINGATGVLTPFGVRRCWRVREPGRVEKLVHAALGDCRVRADREFFRVSIGRAEAEIRGVLTAERLELRTLENLVPLAA